MLSPTNSWEAIYSSMQGSATCTHYHDESETTFKGSKIDSSNYEYTDTHYVSYGDYGDIFGTNIPNGININYQANSLSSDYGNILGLQLNYALFWGILTPAIRAIIVLRL